MRMFTNELFQGKNSNLLSMNCIAYGRSVHRVGDEHLECLILIEVRDVACIHDFSNQGQFYRNDKYPNKIRPN